MPSDLRVPMGPIVETFGVPVVLTRPPPEDAPLATTGIWLSALTETDPFGTEVPRRDPRRVLSVPATATLTTLPRGTVILAPEMSGQAIRTWRVDGYDRFQPDELRVLVVPMLD